jgi:hypothetical protein
MIREYWLFLACLIFALLVVSVNGAVFAADNSISVIIKYDNGLPTVSEQFIRLISGKGLAGKVLNDAPEQDTEQSLINVIGITSGDETYYKNIQTPKISNIYVSSRTVRDTDIMQTTNEPGYPVLEIYWGYEQDVRVPWKYYMRVNNIGDTAAVYSVFATKRVFTKTISPSRTVEIINSGVIPDWSTL